MMDQKRIFIRCTACECEEIVYVDRKEKLWTVICWWLEGRHAQHGTVYLCDDKSPARAESAAPPSRGEDD